MKHSPQNSPFDADQAWRQLQAHDAQGGFFYGVATTGVYCRAGCKSRLPQRRNVRFFVTAAEAEAAGFRACRRCHPSAGESGQASERMVKHLEAHQERAVPLAELGRLTGLSPFTAQRQFKQQMGVSPSAYQRALRARALRAALKQGANVTEAIYAAGYGAPSRASADAPLGMSPARFARGGKGERIGYACSPSEFGWMMVGATERGLCWLALAADQDQAGEDLRQEFPLATLEADACLAWAIEAALGVVSGQSAAGVDSLPLDLRGTAFQLKVWQALQRIPRGAPVSYSQLALQLGMPTATRAVARACGSNRVALLVPCHRVVGSSGALTGYRWGIERKQRLLEAEALPAERATPQRERGEGLMA